MTRDDLVLWIQEYVADEILPEYTYVNIRSKFFETQSYISWATDELIMYIDTWFDDENPTKALEEFAENMKRYSSFNEQSERMFDIAYELTTNILDIIKAMN